MNDHRRLRAHMVEAHLARRGIDDPRILGAFADVPREEFVPTSLAEFAYDDAPLPIGLGQTISQPYIVAYTIRALALRGDERVLEVGTGSGYAAAILGRLAKEVFTIERLPELAASAEERLARLHVDNVHVVVGDGSLGLEAHAPYDAIAIAAGGPSPPPALLAQLAIGGRLVMPVGIEDQMLVCIRRESEDQFRREQLGAVRFVPLIGEQAFTEDPWPNGRRRARTRPGEGSPLAVPPSSPRGSSALPVLVREEAEPIDDIDRASLDALLDRIGDANLVLMGEATHGTSEFYRMRARITRDLIQRRGFRFVAVEADWPDAARIDDYVRGGERRSKLDFVPFARFPAWMWRNEEVHDFVEWLRAYDADHPRERIGFHGLDLYSLFTSIGAVLAYLGEVDPAAERVARHRYGALTPWQKDPAAYGEAVLRGEYESSEPAVVAMLRDMLSRRLEYARSDGDRFFDATRNAQLVADAERYYREMYYGSAASWNLRDAHMFETLRSLFAFYGAGAKGIVWEHNSHVGDATATEMSVRGEHNVGQLSRAWLGGQVYLIGFGTDHGTVAAAPRWGDPMERMSVVPAAPGSYEHVCHESRVPAFALHLRAPRKSEVRDDLEEALLERAIGVVYRPTAEMLSHYFHASLPRQFDEYVWFDETRAVRPLPDLPRGRIIDLPDTYPFGL